jgi:hypothetical protein
MCEPGDLWWVLILIVVVLMILILSSSFLVGGIITDCQTMQQFRISERVFNCEEIPNDQTR